MKVPYNFNPTPVGSKKIKCLIREMACSVRVHLIFINSTSVCGMNALFRLGGSGFESFILDLAHGLGYEAQVNRFYVKVCADLFHGRTHTKD